MFTNAAARPGDKLVLTKKLGTGILTTALKRDLLPEAGLAEAVASMTALNDGAARAAASAGVRCATDVTGFGLLGHLGNILAAQRGRGADRGQPASGVSAGARARGRWRRFRRHPAQPRRGARLLGHDITQAERFICTDAQTSGGLLLAVAPGRLDALLAALEAERTPAAAVIGEILPAGAVLQVVRAAEQ